MLEYLRAQDFWYFTCWLQQAYPYFAIVLRTNIQRMRWLSQIVGMDDDTSAKKLCNARGDGEVVDCISGCY